MKEKKQRQKTNKSKRKETREKKGDKEMAQK